MEYDICFVDRSKEEEWDSFLFNDSINGTFLQSRKFLNYHEAGRFQDCSLMIYRKRKLVALCPACEILMEGLKTFVSHQGSTYGGLVISNDLIRLELLISLIEEIEKFLYERGYNKLILKPTMSIFCKEQDESVNYALNQSKYTEYKELNLYIDFTKCDKDLLTNLSKLKKRQVKKCITKGVELQELTSREEIEKFHSVLTENLKKYDKKPVHSVDELMDLKENRFPEIIHIYGAYYNGQIVAGTMTFEFPDCSCAHTQYLAALTLDDISPMSYIYYSMMNIYKEKGYRYLSWGIATEHYGEGVNWGLMRNKEEFGSRHCVNYIYEKML